LIAEAAVTDDSVDTDQAAPLPGVDLDALGDWLAPRLELGSEALRGELIAGGRSNLTYLLHSGEHRWVLRRPPLGRRLASAHNMSREETVLRALASSDVPVPAVVASCEDDELLGAPFYVMEYVAGRVIRSPDDLDLGPAECRHCALALVQTLAELHTLDYEQLGLGSFGRPQGYLERQMRRWFDQLDASRVRELPLLDELGRRLATALPQSEAGTILHGDYRIDNVLLMSEDPTRIAAVLDWEMSTLGDPLCDLGMLLMYWGRPGERFASPVHAITAAAGFPERDELSDLYGELTGFSLEHLRFYIAFSYFKLAVIVEGIHARHIDGLTVGEGYGAMAAIPPVLAEQGLDVIG
jgi:aminoglycoside phosphotransferase (APT) family kinase protein